MPGVPGKRTLTAGLSSARALAIALTGLNGATRGALPHRDVIQRSFGRFAVGDVAVATGGAAATASAALGARAYASGGEIAFARAPDLHTAAHEAAHVVQQRAGVALKGAVGERGDVYEQHADRVADLVVRGQSAEATLAELAGSPGGGAAVQRVADPFAVHLDAPATTVLQLADDDTAATSSDDAAPLPAEDDQAGWIAMLNDAAQQGRAALAGLLDRAGAAAARHLPAAGEFVMEVIWPSNTGWRFTGDLQAAAFIGLEMGLEVAGRALGVLTITRQGGEVTIEISGSLEGGGAGDAEFVVGGKVGGKLFVEASQVKIEADVGAALWDASVAQALTAGDIGAAMAAMRRATPTLWDTALVSWEAAAGADLAASGGGEIPGVAEAGIGGNLDGSGGESVEEEEDKVTTELKFTLAGAMSGSVEMTAPARDAVAKLYGVLFPGSDPLNPDSPALRNGDVMPGTSDAGTSVNGGASVTLGLRTIEYKDGRPTEDAIGIIVAGEAELALVGQRGGGEVEVGVYYPVQAFVTLVDDLAQGAGPIINQLEPIEFSGSLHLTVADITAMGVLPGFDVSALPGIGDDADQVTATVAVEAAFDPAWIVTPPGSAPPSLTSLFARAKALLDEGQVIEAARAVFDAISLLPGSSPDARLFLTMLDASLELELEVADLDHVGDAATPAMGEVPGAAAQGGLTTAKVYQYQFGPDAPELSPPALVGLLIRLLGGA